VLQRIATFLAAPWRRRRGSGDDDDEADDDIDYWYLW
jgi:hypothetical protein